MGWPPPGADYFPSGEKSRWNLSSADGTQPTVSTSCKESVGKYYKKQTETKKHSTLSSGSNWRISPDVVVVQPQHLQVLEQADALRDLGQTVPVQQEL